MHSHLLRMNIGLFGGTFDPVHKGHVVVARAAADRFQLGKVYFIPANMPPHRQNEHITAFHHRYAMLALATVGENRFLPSLAEAPAEQNHLSFTIDTVRKFKQGVRKSDHLFFLIGIDAFLQVASWRRSEELLREIDFIVVSRPGFSMADVGDALPQPLRPTPAVLRAFKKSPAKGTLALGSTVIHILEDVKSGVSATEVRRAAAGGKALARFVDPRVAEYIRKMGLYRTGKPPGAHKTHET
jgi:nicotinate-nucleotide adenylyltransferase